MIVDLEAMTAEVPADKVRRTLAAIEKAMADEWVSAKDLQSLLGLLGFVGQVLVSGRWRVPWTIIAMRMAMKSGYSPMNGWWLEELQWWSDLLNKWNRVSMILNPELLIPLHSADVAPFTDASGGEANGGAGAVFGKYWMAFLFTKEELAVLPICDLEGVVSVLWLVEVCQRWPEQIAGRRFLAWCDNTTFVDCVNNHKSAAPSLAYLLLVLHDLMARYSFEIRLKYVKSEENVAADAASREEWDKFYTFMESVGFPRADLVRIPVQEEVRRSITSEMMSRRLLKEGMLSEQKPVG